jgi:hypothetical protein
MKKREKTNYPVRQLGNTTASMVREPRDELSVKVDEADKGLHLLFIR